jgi:cation:H+ antiporter
VGWIGGIDCGFMWIDLLGILFGLVLLACGGDSLVRGSASLALRMGVSALVVGLTVVAFGTSAPELLVSIKASLQERGDIAAGNVVGSNIVNIAAILGLAALVRPLRVKLQLLLADAPIMIGGSLLLAWMMWDGRIDRWEGLVLAAGIVVYTSANIAVSRRHHSPEVDAEFGGAVPGLSKSLWLDLLFIGLGLGLLVWGSRVLVDHAVILATGMGVSEAVIGLTIVAVGTSMPELATSVVAALKKEADIAIGNAIGSNIFNIFAVVGIAGSVHPFTCAGITPLDLGAMLVIAILLLPLLATGRTLARWEGGLLFACYVVYLYLLWPK